MRKGPGWKLKSPSGAEFTGTLREVLHVWKASRLVEFLGTFGALQAERG